MHWLSRYDKCDALRCYNGVVQWCLIQINVSLPLVAIFRTLFLKVNDTMHLNLSSPNSILIDLDFKYLPSTNFNSGRSLPSGVDASDWPSPSVYD